MGSKKKTIVVTSDPLALIAEKTNVIRSKEKVVVSSDSEGSEADDFKSNAITVRRKDILPKTARKQRSKMLLVKKDKGEQVLLAEDQAWMESRDKCKHGLYGSN
uniref:Uncharacterized protein n=1 Tax=Tanacetum cinerariifolium TaxID=118510 RepID=A0A699UFY9_TANCI|nr:hypothetical protein [Tanacetum cinerariifolium]